MSFLQLSTVCRKLAAAVAQLPSLQHDFHLLGNEGLPPDPCSLNSKLVVSWASQFKSMHVQGEHLSIPGLAAFVAAATSLKSVDITCYDEGQAAQADMTFSSSMSIKDMCLSGQHMPCILPSSLEVLYLIYEDVEWCGCGVVEDRDRVLLHSMLCRLVRLPHLRTLTINLGLVTQLSSYAVLPKVEYLQIMFRLDDWSKGSFNLSWLERQACRRLHIVVWIYTEATQPQLELQRELQRLEHLQYSLEIETYVNFSLPLHDAWRAIRTSAFTLSQKGP